jgi:methyl-accepting chemotaxis protein
MIKEIFSSTESGFLRVGGSLQHLYKQARAISDLSTDIASRLSGDELKHNIMVLQALLRQLRTHDEHSQKGLGTLNSLQEQIFKLRNQLHNFSKTTMNLRAISNLIRIETARLKSEETGFHALSDDVRKFADDVTRKATDLSQLTDQMLGITMGALKKMKDFAKDHQSQAMAVFNQTMQSLEAVEGRYQSSDLIIRDIADRWSQISRNINEVVMSMQFHDITRQRIEHVCEALDTIQNLAATPTNIKSVNYTDKRSQETFSSLLKGKEDYSLGKAVLAIPLCEVQVAQLQHATDDFIQAIEKIVKNLVSISQEISLISQETQTLGRSGNEQGDSFLADLQNNLALLAKSIIVYKSINREWCTSLEQVRQTLTGMSGFIREIEKIGIDTKTLALNACIQAAHIGDEGASLGVLAESIRALSTETSLTMDEISISMGNIMHQAASLASLEQDGEKSQGRIESEIEQEIIQMLAPIKDLDQEICDHLIQIEEKGQAVIHEINSSASEVGTHKLIDDRISSVLEAMRTFIDETKSACTDVVDCHDAIKMDGLEHRYTMEKEREIHQAALLTSAAVIATPVKEETADIHQEAKQSETHSAMPQSDEGLGDNVELF